MNVRIISALILSLAIACGGEEPAANETPAAEPADETPAGPARPALPSGWTESSHPLGGREVAFYVPPEATVEPSEDSIKITYVLEKPTGGSYTTMYFINLSESETLDERILDLYVPNGLEAQVTREGDGATIIIDGRSRESDRQYTYGRVLGPLVCEAGYNMGQNQVPDAFVTDAHTFCDAVLRR
ncbi:MAG: hypothetical protein AAGE52_21680 [Myxococcota bacterium]